MSNTTDLQTQQTHQEQHLPTTPAIPDVCQIGDKECIARLIQAFSDCD